MEEAQKKGTAGVKQKIGNGGDGQGAKPSNNATSDDDAATVDSGNNKPAQKSRFKKTSKGSGQKLQREIGLFSAVAIIIGSIIGSGIFISPKGVLVAVGSPGAALIVWVTSGIYCIVGAYCYAELATMIPSSGGDYIYIMKAFGSFWGFLRLWVEVIVVRPCTYAIVSLAFAIYIVFPLFPSCEQPENVKRLLSAAGILLLTFFNSWSVRASTLIQNVFTVAKVIALIMLIVTGFVVLGKGEATYSLELESAFEGTTTNIGDFCLGFYSGLFAYNGWTWLNIVVEEMRNPERNFPLAIAIALGIVIVVYASVNVAYFALITPVEMLTTPAVAVLVAERSYGAFWWVIPVFVSFSCFGSVNGGLLTASRLLFVGGREGHMPQALNLVSITRKTPAPAVVFTGLLSLVYLVSTDLYKLINYVAFCNWGAIMLAVISLLVFRRTMPDAERPIKVNLIFPFIYILVSVVLLVFASISSPVETGLGIVIVLTGVPVYLLCVAWKTKTPAFKRFIRNITQFTQKIFHCAPEHKQN